MDNSKLKLCLELQYSGALFLADEGYYQTNTFQVALPADPSCLAFAENCITSEEWMEEQSMVKVWVRCLSTGWQSWNSLVTHSVMVGCKLSSLAGTQWSFATSETHWKSSVESMLYKGYYVLLAAEVGLASHLWRKYQPTWLKGTLLERAEQSRRIAGVEESPAPTKSHTCTAKAIRSYWAALNNSLPPQDTGKVRKHPICSKHKGRLLLM